MRARRTFPRHAKLIDELIKDEYAYRLREGIESVRQQLEDSYQKMEPGSRYWEDEQEGYER